MCFKIPKNIHSFGPSNYTSRNVSSKVFMDVLKNLVFFHYCDKKSKDTK